MCVAVYYFIHDNLTMYDNIISCLLHLLRLHGNASRLVVSVLLTPNVRSAVPNVSILWLNESLIQSFRPFRTSNRLDFPPIFRLSVMILNIKVKRLIIKSER